MPAMIALIGVHSGLGALGWYFIVTKTWGDIGYTAKSIIGLIILCMVYHLQQVVRSVYKDLQLISISVRGVEVAGEGLKSFESAVEFYVGLHAGALGAAIKFRDGYLYAPYLIGNKYPTCSHFILDHIVAHPEREKIYTTLDTQLKRGQLISVFTLSILGLIGPVCLATWMTVDQPIMVGALLSAPVWFALYRLSQPVPKFENLLEDYKQKLIEQRKSTATSSSRAA